MRDYTYNLPPERIARYPLESREHSRLLTYSKKGIEQTRFSSLPSLLPSSSILFFNNTKVIHARLKFRRNSGAGIEIFCLSPEDPIDYQESFAATGSCTWNCLVGNLKKWKEVILELKLAVRKMSCTLRAMKLKQDNEIVLVRFDWDVPFSFAEIIESAGIIPIPPYLDREPEESDNLRYQTVYSRYDGSVAAPTAGLHFTDKILDELRSKQINLNEITLHVGAGTFRPVKTDNALEHSMHSEFFTVSPEILEKLAAHRKPLVAIGTTTLRALESLYWLALKSVQLRKVITTLDQWEYRKQKEVRPPQEVFGEFIALLKKEQRPVYSASTRIMIVPGYDFQLVDGLITNYHQPQSTLLLLVAAFIGEDWKKVYEYALNNDFRFLSYGDSSLLWRA